MKEENKNEITLGNIVLFLVVLGISCGLLFWVYEIMIAQGRQNSANEMIDYAENCNIGTQFNIWESENHLTKTLSIQCFDLKKGLSI